MSVLSVTFHTIESELQNWSNFVKTDLKKIIEPLGLELAYYKVVSPFLFIAKIRNI